MFSQADGGGLWRRTFSISRWRAAPPARLPPSMAAISPARHGRALATRAVRDSYGSTEISSVVFSLFECVDGLSPIRWVLTIAPSCGENRLSPLLPRCEGSSGVILKASFFTAQLPEGNVTQPSPV